VLFVSAAGAPPSPDPAGVPAVPDAFVRRRPWVVARPSAPDAGRPDRPGRARRVLHGRRRPSGRPTTGPSQRLLAGGHRAPATAAATRARPPVALAVKPLGKRLRPDVLVTGPRSFSDTAVASSAPRRRRAGTVVFRAGTVRVGGKPVRVVGVDPSTFRSFASQGTAESTAVWQASPVGRPWRRTTRRRR
jgi:hypothetical protein